MRNTAASCVLVCAFDEEYALPAAVALSSLSIHWTGSRPLEVHVLDSGITARSRRRVEESILNSHMNLHWHPIDPERFSDLPVRAGMRPHIYHSLALGEAVPDDVERAVWLDVDTLVQRCVSELWELDLKGRPLGAVQDMAIPWVSSSGGLAEFGKLGLSPDTPYFNAGLLVVEMGPWRHADTASRLRDYVVKNADVIRLGDQDAFNALFAADWTALDPRWNVIATLAGRAYYRCRHLTPRVYENVATSPWVLHFAGTFKPWTIQLPEQVGAPYAQRLRDVAFEAPPPGPLEKMLSLYYRYFRRILYPAEKLCWSLRLRLSAR